METSAERVRDVEQRTAGLRKELGLPTLVLTQIMFIVGSGWVGTAAKLGTGHVVFWIAAMAIFYLPQAAVVIYLNRLMPLEGGLYQWATVGFGPLGGFITAWNLWAFAILILATFGVMIATNLAYLIGSTASWLTGAAWYTPIVSAICIVFITFLAIFGLRAGKWMQAIGGAAQVLTYGALLAVPFVALHRGMIHEYHPFAASIPAFTALNFNLLGKMALGALSGFEYVALLAGECKNPAKTIGRSVIIASPIIAVMFVLGTSTVLALVPRDQIDLVSPIPQTLTIAFRGMGFASILAPLLIGLLLLRQIGNASLMFTGTTRLPMVAGWDGLLPRWFTRLHPRSQTPVNSILFVERSRWRSRSRDRSASGCRRHFRSSKTRAEFSTPSPISRCSAFRCSRRGVCRSGQSSGFAPRRSRAWRRRSSTRCCRSSRSSTSPIGGSSRRRS